MTKLILPSHLAQNVSDSSSRALVCTTMYADKLTKNAKEQRTFGPCVQIPNAGPS